MSTVRQTLHEVIFGTTTPAGRRFDLLLIVAILLSVMVILLDSMPAYHHRYGLWFTRAEWFFTLLFTLEYCLRLYCAPKPWRYVRGFYGIVDLLAILPTYLGLLLPSANYLMVVRLLRVLRIFRILKLYRYLEEAHIVMRAFTTAKRRIIIFLFSILVIVTVFGALMFVVEGPEAGFSSIPESIYWAIVTVTTVGYGDITPHTGLGQFISALAMLTGYATIAIITGIFSTELIMEIQRDRKKISCQQCQQTGHDGNAQYCKFCGAVIKLKEMH